MGRNLSAVELEVLAKFRMTDIKISHPLSISMVELIDRETTLQYLNYLAKHLGTTDLKVTASLFTKRYAFLAVIYLYSLTVWNKKLDVSLENLSIETDKESALWLPSFYFNKQDVQISDANRSEFREMAISHLFKESFYPVLDALSVSTKVSKLILWENILVYIYWLYETVIPSIEDEKLSELAVEDLHYILDAPGHLFGPYHENPFKRYGNTLRFVERLNEEVRIRKTCCFSYVPQDNGIKCKTCPQVCNG
ncbi:hypothetical protein LS684_17800 [Cytobacillus spongiae]|uniref:IucA/IucC family C-terminal-domain containing protein n=1 Tax=Cytobacillus spongiae TaxID=2901381 RepID=UPI001F1B3A98|nr:IucA/IucC family C-terminal-domain containing protein [Cytobacillus spongiae]UII55464.1 hypothetical protein LS684_17800 [Cytobacillus spongiae]